MAEITVQVLPMPRSVHIDQETRDVREFHHKFQLPVGDKGPKLIEQSELLKRYHFLAEELEEFAQGYDGMDMEKMADALVDLVYVAKGTAVMLGLPWEDLWADVQRANMEKVRDTVIDAGGCHKHGVTKPEGWNPPYTKSILEAYGWGKADE